MGCCELTFTKLALVVNVLQCTDRCMTHKRVLTDWLQPCTSESNKAHRTYTNHLYKTAWVEFRGSYACTNSTPISECVIFNYDCNLFMFIPLMFPRRFTSKLFDEISIAAALITVKLKLQSVMLIPWLGIQWKHKTKMPLCPSQNYLPGCTLLFQMWQKIGKKLWEVGMFLQWGWNMTSP